MPASGLHTTWCFTLTKIKGSLQDYHKHDLIAANNIKGEPTLHPVIQETAQIISLVSFNQSKASETPFSAVAKVVVISSYVHSMLSMFNPISHQTT